MTRWLTPRFGYDLARATAGGTVTHRSQEMFLVESVADLAGYGDGSGGWVLPDVGESTVRARG